MSNYETSAAESYALGIDIGSTTVKIAILNKNHEILFPITNVISRIYRTLLPLYLIKLITNWANFLSVRSLPVPEDSRLPTI